MPGTALPLQLDGSLFAQIASANIDTEEAVRLVMLFASAKNPAVERTLTRAYRALQFIRTDVQTVTALQSLFFGWLLPYWQILGLSKDQIEYELDGGKVNGSSVDKRLAASAAPSTHLPGARICSRV